MRSSITISGTLMAHARQAYHRCIEDRRSGRVSVTEDNNFSFHALTVYIMSATALEAFVNEVCLAQIPMKTSKVHIPIEMVENMEIRSKYYLLPLLLWGKTFDRGTRPYQDFEVLIRLRNYLVHYKMTPSGGGEMPKFAEHLKDKNLLMTSGTPGVGLAGGLLTELCSAKAALWAYNTTCQMATNLIQLADDTTKQLWQGMLDNFREIPDQYWKSLIPASKPT